MFPSMEKKEQIESEYSGTFQVKLVTKNIVAEFQGGPKAELSPQCDVSF